MFGFYKSSIENYEDTFITNRKIIQKLIEKKIMEISNFNNYSIPYSMENIIPKIEELSKNPLIMNAISEVLNIESFLDQKEYNIDQNTLYGKDYIIINGVYFTNNPLSNPVLKLKELMKNENNILFSKIGYISTSEFLDLYNDIENNKEKYIKENSLTKLKIEFLFNKFINESLIFKANSLKLFLNKGVLKSVYNIGTTSIEKDIMTMTIKEYDLFSNYIQSFFNDGSFFMVNNSQNIKMKIFINSSNELNKTSKILDIKIYNMSDSFFNLNDLNLSIFDRKDFERKLELPYGLLVLSSKNCLKDLIYSTLKNQYLKKDYKNIYSIEKSIEKNLKDIIQIELKDNDIKKIEYENNNILAFDNINSSEDFDFILNNAANGKFVILGINSNNSTEAFSKIYKLTKDVKMLSDNLLGILHVDQIKEVCKNCSSEIELIKHPIYQDLSVFDKSPKMNDLVRIENKKGCDQCLQGFLDNLEVFEYLSNDNILQDIFMSEFNLRELRIEKNSESWENIYESASVLLKEGKITPNSIINSLGRPKKL